MDLMAEHPHCNPDILHAPKTCFYCDKYEDRQLLRQVMGLPFTPPEANGWSGNVAVQRGQEHTHLGATYVVGDGDPIVPDRCCRNAKRGWYCTRNEHLEGPCALLPKRWNLAAQWKYRR